MLAPIEYVPKEFLEQEVDALRSRKNSRNSFVEEEQKKIARITREATVRNSLDDASIQRIDDIREVSLNKELKPDAS